MYAPMSTPIDFVNWPLRIFCKYTNADTSSSPPFARLPKVFAVFLDMFISHPTASMKPMRDRTTLSTRKIDYRMYIYVLTQHSFFWFFESRKDPHKAPLSIWLNGGPGGSSMMGALSENGPCFVNSDSNSTHLNPWSWNNEVRHTAGRLKSTLLTTRKRSTFCTSTSLTRSAIHTTSSPTSLSTYLPTMKAPMPSNLAISAKVFPTRTLLSWLELLVARTSRLLPTARSTRLSPFGTLPRLGLRSSLNTNLMMRRFLYSQSLTVEGKLAQTQPLYKTWS